MRMKAFAMSIKSKTIVTFFIILIFVGIYAIFSKEETQTSECICPIKYGKAECINSTFFIPFHNPNTMELKDIQLIIKKSRGLDIANVDKPLISNKTEVLQMFSCYDTDDIKIKWCCNNTCCEASLKEYSEDVKLVK